MKNAAILFATLISCGSVPVLAQLPETFENLQVLDPKTDGAELIEMMKGFTAALGVRCNHCHVGSADTLEGMDFASDELPTKRTAREMISMVNAINSGHLVGLPVAVEENRPTMGVSCYSCHRGMTRPPVRTNEMLEGLVEREGVDAALSRYEEWKARYENAGVYDLRPVVLFRLARAQLQQENLSEALAVLDALHEESPDMGDAWALRAQVELARGDVEAAEKALATAREVDPEARLADWVAQFVEQARRENE